MKSNERFWVKVGKTEKCWNWLAGTDKKGYGSFFFNGAMRRAPRFAYELLKAPIPKGQQVLHTCDNRRCVNPDHLFLGTNLDNVRDRQEKNRQARGSRNGRSRLNEQLVCELRAGFARKPWGFIRAKARELAIPYPTLQSAINGRSWKDVGAAKEADDE